MAAGFRHCCKSGLLVRLILMLRMATATMLLRSGLRLVVGLLMVAVRLLRVPVGLFVIAVLLLVLLLMRLLLILRAALGAVVVVE